MQHKYLKYKKKYLSLLGGNLIYDMVLQIFDKNTQTNLETFLGKDKITNIIKIVQAGNIAEISDELLPQIINIITNPTDPSQILKIITQLDKSNIMNEIHKSVTKVGVQSAGSASSAGKILTKIGNIISNNKYILFTCLVLIYLKTTYNAEKQKLDKKIDQRIAQLNTEITKHKTDLNDDIDKKIEKINEHINTHKKDIVDKYDTEKQNIVDIYGKLIIKIKTDYQYLYRYLCDNNSGSKDIIALITNYNFENEPDNLLLYITQNFCNTKDYECNFHSNICCVLTCSKTNKEIYKIILYFIIDFLLKCTFVIFKLYIKLSNEIKNRVITISIKYKNILAIYNGLQNPPSVQQTQTNWTMNPTRLISAAFSPLKKAIVDEGEIKKTINNLSKNTDLGYDPLNTLVNPLFRQTQICSDIYDINNNIGFKYYNTLQLSSNKSELPSDLSEAAKAYYSHYDFINWLEYDSALDGTEEKKKLDT